MHDATDPWARRRGGTFLLAFALLAGLPGLTGAQAQAVNWRQALTQDAAWYAGDEARRIADNVLLSQHDNGGWDKNFDHTRRLSDADRAALAADRGQASTIDNGGTTMEMIYLAKVYDATSDPACAEAFLRGFDFLIEMQYDHGGWPQYYPLQGGYHDAITFNDDAMVRVLNLLTEVARGASPYAFVDAPRRRQARAAVEKGVEAILATQVVVDGRRTAWCAQHDPHTFEPVAARTYEHASLSGMETIPILRFLMGLDDPDPRVIEAVHAGMTWLDAVKLTGVAMVETTTDGKPDRVLIEKPDAAPLWARFYEIGTNRPIFCGRDGVIRYDMAQIEQERRAGYRWYSGRANELFETTYPVWRQRHAGAGGPDARAERATTAE